MINVNTWSVTKEALKPFCLTTAPDLVYVRLQASPVALVRAISPVAWIFKPPPPRHATVVQIHFSRRELVVVLRGNRFDNPFESRRKAILVGVYVPIAFRTLEKLDALTGLNRHQAGHFHCERCIVYGEKNGDKKRGQPPLFHSRLVPKGYRQSRTTQLVPVPPGAPGPWHARCRSGSRERYPQPPCALVPSLPS